MGSDNELKIRRPRRSKADIEEAIQKAATAQIKKKGFSMVLMTDIVKRAKIEPIVFYNRYKNLDEFYDTFVKNYDYWISDLIREHSSKLETEEGFREVLDALLDNLLDDRIMTELLRWEVSDGNHITERTAKLREIHSMDLINLYKGLFGDNDIDAAAIWTLAVSGIYFLVLHKDRSSFGGIDLNTPEGVERMHECFDTLAKMLFTYRAMRKEGAIIAERMRKEGLSEKVIERCLDGLAPKHND